MIRSLVEQARERRAKSLRLAESRLAPVQAPIQEPDKFERKAEVIAIWERCRDRYGISLREFIRQWDHKYATGHGYLDPDEKRYPKARSVRTARALEQYLAAMADLDAAINAAKGTKVA